MEGSVSSVGHRGSLPFPTQTNHAQHPPFPLHPDPRYSRNRSISGTSYSFYSPTPHPKPGPWLNKLCLEPEGDIGTCCLGFWLPCALYGNTQYRLKQMAQGDDPLDLSEHDACNGPCWMYQMLTCCFKIDWCVVMLQHSRIRATYNIDGTPGGDCVQSFFCTCCTVIQDEREVLARERRIIAQRGGGNEITQQPGYQPQMRYSTSNLLEEIPEVFRREANNGRPSFEANSYPPSHQASGQTSTHEIDNYARFAVGESDTDDDAIRHSRRSSSGSRKMKVRSASPAGSALNPKPIPSRSASVDFGKGKQVSILPQRSVTNPSSRSRNSSAFSSSSRAPSPRLLTYKLRSLTQENPDFQIDTIRESSMSESSGPTIKSTAAVKSMPTGSLRSQASKSGLSNKRLATVSKDDLRVTDGQTLFYNSDGKLVRRKISDCMRDRASTPEPDEIYDLHHRGIDRELGQMKTDDTPKTRSPCIVVDDTLSENGSAYIRKHALEFEKQLAAQDVPLRTDSALSGPLLQLQFESLGPASATIDLLTMPPLAAVSGNSARNGDQLSKKLATISPRMDPLSSRMHENDVETSLLGTLKDTVSDVLKPIYDRVRSGGPVGESPISGISSPDTMDLSGHETQPANPPNQARIVLVPSDSTDNSSGINITVESPSSGVMTPNTARNEKAAAEQLDSYATELKRPFSPSAIDTIAHRNTSPLLPILPKPRHKKSVSDWFKEIGSSNSKVSSIVATPSLEHDYSNPWRPFSPLGMRGSSKGRGNGMSQTLRSALGPRLDPWRDRSVTAPIPLDTMPSSAHSSPLEDTTNLGSSDVTVGLTLVDTVDGNGSPFRESDERSVSSPKANNIGAGQSELLSKLNLSDENGPGQWFSTKHPSALEPSHSLRQALPNRLRQSYLRNEAHFSFDEGRSEHLNSQDEKENDPVVGISDVVDHVKEEAQMKSATPYDMMTLMDTIKEVATVDNDGSTYPPSLDFTLEQEVPRIMLSGLETPSQLPAEILAHIPSSYSGASDNGSGKALSTKSSLKNDDSASTGGHVIENQEIAPSTGGDAAPSVAVSDALVERPDLEKKFSFPPLYFSETAVIDFAFQVPRRLSACGEIVEEGSRTGASSSEDSDATAKPDMQDMRHSESMDSFVSAVSEVPTEKTLVPSDGSDDHSDMMLEMRPTIPHTTTDLNLKPSIPDHPASSERIDDAVAALAGPVQSSEGAMLGQLAAPIAESDVLRDVCDRINSHNLSYETDSGAFGSEDTIVRVPPPVKPPQRATQMLEGGAPVKALLTPLPVTPLYETPGAAGSAGKGKEWVDEDMHVELPKPAYVNPTTPKRVQSPAETMLRGMLGLGMLGSASKSREHLPLTPTADTKLNAGNRGSVSGSSGVKTRGVSGIVAGPSSIQTPTPQTRKPSNESGVQRRKSNAGVSIPGTLSPGSNGKGKPSPKRRRQRANKRRGAGGEQSTVSATSGAGK